MELVDAINTRRSVRRFSAREVSEMTVKKLLVLANAAPSAGNTQARDFVVVRNKKTKMALADAALGQDFIVDAPVVVVVCGNLERSGKHYGHRGMSLYHVQDADAAVENLLLAIHDEGLGSCWIGAFSETDVRKILDLPDDVRPLAILPIGFPAGKIREGKPNRIKIDKLMHFEKW